MTAIYHHIDTAITSYNKLHKQYNNTKAKPLNNCRITTKNTAEFTRIKNSF